MKKAISVFLCAALVFGVFCFGAAASAEEKGKPQISFTEITGNPGNDVFAGIYIADNTKITDYVLTLEFDKSALKYKGFSKGLLGDYTIYDHTDEGRLTLVSLNENSKAANGCLITFEFTIDKSAKAGDYKLNLSKASFADKEGDAQNATVKSGNIKVSKPCSEKHEFSKWESVVAANCVDEGTDIRLCKKCGCTESKTVKAKGHKLEKTFTIDVEATDSSPGMLSRHCKECGAKTNIIVYTANNTAGLNINSMVGKISDDSLSNLIYFINGNVTYPDITDEDFDVKSLLKNTDSAVSGDGSINAAAVIDRILRKIFGNDKKSGIVGAIKRAALADEIPVKLIGKLVRLIFAW